MSENKQRFRGNDRKSFNRLGSNKVKNWNENNPVIQSFRQYAMEIDDKHDRYERIIKYGRDITIESKRIIFLLHTADKRKDNFTKILQDAKKRLLDLCQIQFAGIAKELYGFDIYQYSRAYSSGLQEFIEAYTYHEYLCGVKISDWNDLQTKLTYDKLKLDQNDLKSVTACKELIEVESIDSNNIDENTSCNNIEQSKVTQGTEEKYDECSNEFKNNKYHCLIKPMEFMLGLADLSGEVMRRCITSLGNGDIDTCFEVCEFLRQMYSGYISLGRTHNKEISRKIYTLRESVLKVENVCYNVKVRGGEAAKWGADDEIKHKINNKYSSDEDEGFIHY